MGDDREDILYLGRVARRTDPGRTEARDSPIGAASIRLWEFATEQTARCIEPAADFDRRPDAILWIGFSPDGRTLYSL